MLNFGKIYGGEKWKLVSTAKVSSQEIANVNTCKVVSSEYGLSACFMLKNGGQGYIPMSRDTTLVEGDEIKLDSIQIITLVKESTGEAITRIDGQAV